MSMASERLEGLTILRGLAALMVVQSHCLRLAEHSYVGEKIWLPRSIAAIDFGSFSVVLFFVLSGFTLAISHADKPWSFGHLSLFYIRRLFRIYPAYLVSIIVFLAADAVVGSTIGFANTRFMRDFAQHPTPNIMLEYLTLTFNFTHHWFYINNAYWSLPVEFQFYLLLPLLIVLARRQVSHVILLSFVLFLADILYPTNALTFQMLWQFSGGVVAAHFFRTLSFHPPRALLVAALICLSCSAMIITWLYIPSFWFLKHVTMSSASSVLWGAIAIPLVFLTAKIQIPRKPNLFLRCAMWQGESSYSLYLVHNIGILAAYVAITLSAVGGPARLLLLYVIAIPLALGSAALVHIFVERPGNSFGRTLSSGFLRISAAQRAG
jgi:peptidoglycan/LPS O-acetylase OafA/YrhL